MLEDRPYITIVIPVHNEEETLEELYRRLTNALDLLNKSYEIIFINDGSKDRSSQILQGFYQRRPKQIRVIEFSGNFGQHMAIMAGFERVRGEIIVTLDADLQNPPEEIGKLIEASEAGHDVVNTYRKNRQDPWSRRILSKAHNKMRSLLIPHLQMMDEGCMLRAYQRRIVDLVASTGEATTFIPALALSYAVNPIEIPVNHEARFAGQSNYTIYRLIRYNFDLVTNFSLFPLQIFTLLGMFVSFASFIFVVFFLIHQVIMGAEVESVLTLFAILFPLLGMVLLGLGIVGEYIGRIYQELRKRPRFVIQKILE